MGEDVGRYGGCFAVSKGLLDEFGEERIRDTPLSESAFVGAGIGAALGGMRPIVEVMTVNFSLLALDQIVNTAATLCHMSGGQFPVPLVIRMATGAGRQLAAQHSHSLEAWYAHVPGLRVVDAGHHRRRARHAARRARVPGSGADLRADLALQHGGRADGGGRTRRTRRRARAPARPRRHARHLRREPVALLAAAEALAAAASRPRSSTCAACGRSTTPRCSRRCARRAASWSSTRAGAAAASRPRSGCASSSRRFYDLDAPVARVCTDEVPIPYPKHLEDAALPGPAHRRRRAEDVRRWP